MKWTGIWKWFKRYFVVLLLTIVPLLILLEFVPIKGVLPAGGQETPSSREERVFQLVLAGLSLTSSFVFGRMHHFDSLNIFSRDQLNRLRTMYASLQDVAEITRAVSNTIRQNGSPEHSISGESLMGLLAIILVNKSLRRQLLDCLEAWSIYASSEVEQKHMEFVLEERRELDDDN